MSRTNSLAGDSGLSLLQKITGKMTLKQTGIGSFVDNIISELECLGKSCYICDKLNYTMERYKDVIFHLYFKEEDFKKLFDSKKGFCMKHLKELLEGTKKYLNTAQTAQFVYSLMQMQLNNMDRIQKEVNWFTQKFDYQNEDKPWGNSKDAVSRSIEKLTGYCNFK